MRIKSIYGIIIGLLFASCTSVPKDVVMNEKLPEIYPDYIGVTIPAEIAPLNFSYADESVDCIDVVARGSKGGEIHTNGDWADFDLEEWHQLTEQNKGGKITITVCAQKQTQWTQYKDFDVFVSSQPLEEWGQFQ